MKKGFIITSILIVLLLVIGCSSDDIDNAINNTNISKMVNKTTDLVNNVVDEVKDKVTNPEPDETIEEDTNSGSTADFLIEKRVSGYQFDESKAKTTKFMDENFDSYEATYDYEVTKAIVTIMISDGKTNIFELLDSAKTKGNLELLDSRDFDYIDNDVYFDPYQNTYIWASKENIIMIQHSVGTDLLKKYLDKYPPSVVKGSYDNPTSVTFEDDNEEKIIFFNSNQYVIELSEWNDDEIVLVINGKEETLKNSETTVISDLMVSVSIRSEEVIVNIEGEVEDYKRLSMDVGVPVDVKLDKDVTIEVVGANSDDSNIQVEIDGDLRKVNLKQTRTISDYYVKLDDFFVSNLGEEKITIDILVWPKE